MSRRFHPGIRFAALLLAAGCIAAQPAPPDSAPAPPDSAPAPPDSAPAPPDSAPAPLVPGTRPIPAKLPRTWDVTLDSLPDAIRAVIHPSTAHLPPFPGENPAALDPASWPSSVQDSDRVCVLELRTYVRGTPVTLKDIRQRKPGQSLSARYLCGGRGWRAPRYAGPFYVWNKDNELVERSYRVTDGSRYREDLYQYRENGSVWAYRHRERGEDQSGPAFTLDEYYDPNGKLAGFAAEKSGPDSLGAHWRRGAPIEETAFRKWAAEFR